MSEDRIESLLERASEMASERSHEYITLEHLLLSLLQDQQVIKILKDVKADVMLLQADILTHIDQKMNDIIRDGTPPRKTQAIERVFNRAVTQVIFSGRKTLLPRDILVSIMSEKESYALYYLKKNKVTRQSLIQFITKDAINRQAMESAMGDMQNQAGSFETYCQNLNEIAERGDIDDIIGRSVEIDDIAHILARRKKNNVIVVGDPGVGKTAIAEGLAKKIIEKDVPKPLLDKIQR